MHRTLFLISAAFLFAAATAEARWWWPFGSRESMNTPAVQSEAARPIYERAVQAEQAGSKYTARRLYRRVYKRYPAADTAAQSLYQYGSMQFERRSWMKSYEAFQEILVRHADFPRFNEIARFQFDIATALAERQRMLGVIPYRSLNRAVACYEVMISNAPYSDLAPLALMNIAMIHQYRGNSAEAIDALDRLINNYPTSLLASDAYLNLAETFASLVDGPEYDQGATREAMSYFEDFLILFSRHQDVHRAETGLTDMRDLFARSKLVIGEFYFKYRRWYQAAEIFFNEAITIAPESPAAASAREYLVEIERRRALTANTQSEGEATRERSFIRRLLRL
jgi:outer membrane protein assembly factor BamD